MVVIDFTFLNSCTTHILWSHQSRVLHLCFKTETRLFFFLRGWPLFFFHEHYPVWIVTDHTAVKPTASSQGVVLICEVPRSSSIHYWQFLFPIRMTEKDFSTPYFIHSTNKYYIYYYTAELRHRMYIIAWSWREQEKVGREVLWWFYDCKLIGKKEYLCSYTPKCGKKWTWK